MNSKVLLYSTGNYIQYPVINHNGKEYEKYVCVCMCACTSQVAMVVKYPPASVGDVRDSFSPCIRKIPWRRAWQSTPVFLLGKSHGQKSLASYSPGGCQESDTT